MIDSPTTATRCAGAREPRIMETMDEKDSANEYEMKTSSTSGDLGCDDFNWPSMSCAMAGGEESVESAETICMRAFRYLASIGDGGGMSYAIFSFWWVVSDSRCEDWAPRARGAGHRPI